MNAIVTSRPLTISKNVVTYKGPGYFYHCRKTATDISAKIKIGREVMERFIKAKGAHNTKLLPGLTVACQGGGWYELFVINSALSRSVTEFLKRLNQWALRQITSGPVPKKGHRYALEMRHYEHAKPKNQPTPGQFLRNERPKFDPVAAALQIAAPNKIADMVSKFKAKFGKAA